MTAPTESTERAVIQISRPVYTRLVDLKEDQARNLGRYVTFTEVIEQLLEKAGA